MKVNVKNQKSQKKYQHDLSHDVSTTFNFGHVQPLMGREMSAGSTGQFRAAQLVRLQPLNVPTFGRMTLNTYNVFVPMESIYHPYANFRAQQTYRGSSYTYIPTEVPNCTNRFINFIGKTMSRIIFIKVVDGYSASEAFFGDWSKCTAIYSDDQDFSLIQTAYHTALDTDCGVYGSAYSSFTSLMRSNFEDYWDSDDLPQADALELDRYDWYYQFLYDGNTYLCCGTYTLRGDNFRKVVYGLGYKFIANDYRVSLLPIFAYYKAWFDLFAPQRDITWTDTDAFAILEWMEQNGDCNLTDDSVITSLTTDIVNFIYDLSDCYYTQAVDFVSSHITGQRISNVAEQQFVGLSAQNSTMTVGTAGATFSPRIDANSNTVSSIKVTQNNLDILRRLYYRVNSKTVYGGRIKEFLRAELGADYLEENESYWIGSQKLDISVSPVFNNAETQQGTLGEFAGQAVGTTQGTTYKYTADVDGYWITLACIIPDARMSQGQDPNLSHVTLRDFFDPAFDSLTLLPTPQYNIYAEHGLMFAQDVQDLGAGFGNKPNYMEYCVAENILNGDMSKGSTRATYLPYTLDKLLPYTFVDYTATGFRIQNMPSNVIANGDEWRYIGKRRWLGNYDRIFREDGGQVEYYTHTAHPMPLDNKFVSHNYLDFTVWSYKLPVRDSYQTGAFDTDSLTLEKA